MKSLLALIQIFFISCVFGQKDTVKYWGDNDWYCICNIQGKEKQGSYRCFDQSKRLRETGIFKDDKLEGKYQRFGIENNLLETGSYKEGKRNGEWNNYYGNGKLLSLTHYKNDLKEGTYIKYSQKGFPLDSGAFANDKRFGRWSYYSEDGKLLHLVHYKNNLEDGMYLSYSETGLQVDSGAYVSGKRSGRWKFNVYGDSTYYFGEFDNDKQIGDWKVYKANGMLLSSIKYSKGEASSHCDYIYFTNGKIKQVSNFKNEKLDGELKSYYENGNLERIAVYKNGIRNGIDNIYFENGKPEMERFFKKDELNGTFREYYESGELYKEEIFKHTHFDDYRDQLPSSQKFFYKNGKLKALQDKSKIEWYYDNGKMRYQITIQKRGKVEITKYIHYNDTGMQDIVILREDGNTKSVFRMDDLTKTWKETFTCVNELKNGQLLDFSNSVFFNGDIVSISYYKNGLEEGDAIRYCIHGFTTFLGHFKNGKKDGAFVYYDCYPSDGDFLNKSMTYSKDVLNGSFEGFDEDKKMYGCGTYINGAKSGRWFFTNTAGVTIECLY